MGECLVIAEWVVLSEQCRCSTLGYWAGSRRQDTEHSGHSHDARPRATRQGKYLMHEGWPTKAMAKRAAWEKPSRGIAGPILKKRVPIRGLCQPPGQFLGFPHHLEHA